MNTKYHYFEVVLAIGTDVIYHSYCETNMKAKIQRTIRDQYGYCIIYKNPTKSFILDVQIDKTPFVDNNLRTKQIYKLLVK